MTTCVLILVFGLLAYVRSDPTSLETVWLNDVTTRFQTDKRTLGDTDLPHQLTFHLRRGSDDLTLNLRRNYDIDPNADIYFVEQLKDGRSILKKETNLEKEDAAYYQDEENGAYMTARCVKRSIHKCDRVINGNIQIGSRSYDLQPDETIGTSGDILKVPQLLRKRYILRDQANIQHSVETKDEANSNEIDVAMELKAPFQLVTGQNKHSYLQDRWETIMNDHNERSKDGKTRQLKNNYHVKVAVLIDSGVWDKYSLRVNIPDPIRKRDEVQRLIREAYSHVMNGVNLRYKSVEDESMSINVILQNFIFFQFEALFPHKRSRVIKQEGKKYIDVHNYLYDLSQWVNETGSRYVPAFDHAILFTTHVFFTDSIRNSAVTGQSYIGRICDESMKVSVVEVRHYARTVMSASHELGHNLGAEHDGEGEAKACKAEDLFIMTPRGTKLDKNRVYIRNLWLFSNCSKDSFKTKLQHKECVKYPGQVFSIDEWTTYMTKQAGDVFTPQEQCYFFYGPRSVFYGSFSEEICHLLRCTDPVSGRRVMSYLNAARGTQCGDNKWCIDGRCVSKHSK